MVVGIDTDAAEVDPTGVEGTAWGEAVDPKRSRWWPLSRANRWMRCLECRTPLWIGRVITSATVESVSGWGSEEICAGCLRGTERDDPRPAWPAEPTEPPLHLWPKWMRTDLQKRVPLPKHFVRVGRPRAPRRVRQ